MQRLTQPRKAERRYGVAVEADSAYEGLPAAGSPLAGLNGSLSGLPEGPKAKTPEALGGAPP